MSHRRLLWALPLLLLAVSCGDANAREIADLRDLSLGMPVANIPPEEYINLACADNQGIKLPAWKDFRTCPPNEMGLHDISFRFNDEVNPLAAVNDKYEGTKLGGHPVLVRGLVDNSGALQGIRIDTDPNARPFWRKKAFLLALIVKARYGETGWTCREEDHDGETPVGGVFIKEHCEKRSERRHLVLDREIYRRADQALSDFVNATHLLIRQTTER